MSDRKLHAPDFVQAQTECGVVVRNTIPPLNLEKLCVTVHNKITYKNKSQNSADDIKTEKTDIAGFRSSFTAYNTNKTKHKVQI